MVARVRWLAATDAGPDSGPDANDEEEGTVMMNSEKPNDPRSPYRTRTTYTPPEGDDIRAPMPAGLAGAKQQQSWSAEMVDGVLVPPKNLPKKPPMRRAGQVG
jgi:hypothetical protein